MTTSTFTTTHIRVQTEKQFGEVTRDFERQLGKFDPAVFQALRPDAERADDARARIEAMAGSSGFMLFGTMDHGALLSIFGVKTKAIQYVLGNPLIPVQRPSTTWPQVCTPHCGCWFTRITVGERAWSTTSLRRCSASSTTTGSPRSPACWIGSWRT